MSLSRDRSLGVVPDDTIAWKPDTAAQAIVMKQNGKTGPAKTGPEPSMNRVLSLIHICPESWRPARPGRIRPPVSVLN